MSNNIDQKMEFIIEQQAKFEVDIAELKEIQRQQAHSIDRLTETVTRVVAEMREGFENLIVANEVTRKLAEDVANLAISTSRRVSRIESDLEGRS